MKSFFFGSDYLVLFLYFLFLRPIPNSGASSDVRAGCEGERAWRHPPAEGGHRQVDRNHREQRRRASHKVELESFRGKGNILDKIY